VIGKNEKRVAARVFLDGYGIRGRPAVVLMNVLTAGPLPIGAPSDSLDLETSSPRYIRIVGPGFTLTPENLIGFGRKQRAMAKKQPRESLCLAGTESAARRKEAPAQASVVPMAPAKQKIFSEFWNLAPGAWNHIKNSYRQSRVFLLLLAAGMALRLLWLNHQDLWLDEIDTIGYALALDPKNWGHPHYLSFLFYKIAAHIGASEFCIRFPSALFGILGIPVFTGFCGGCSKRANRGEHGARIQSLYHYRRGDITQVFFHSDRVRFCAICQKSSFCRFSCFSFSWAGGVEPSGVRAGGVGGARRAFGGVYPRSWCAGDGAQRQADVRPWLAWSLFALKSGALAFGLAIAERSHVEIAAPMLARWDNPPTP
jgi:hypothetical protein